ncbi:hypothetical protein V5O48_003416 [Marasmius crinis-equi]|uniref:PEBP-like protein n=1 Tax=Marasmius crinis-equi TaxID=585013 RepID=A0ABR3FSW3_9AGAR
MLLQHSLLGVLALFATTVSPQDNSLAEVAKAFNNANIPRDLTLKFNPSVLLEVTLPQPSGGDITLKAGLQLPRDDTAGPPRFSIRGNAGRGPFVLAAVDPDAPSPTNTSNAQVRHLLAGNFFASSGGELHPLTNTTPAISDYRQPTPTSGLHRYVFLLFRQSPDFNDQTLVNATTPITRFNISVFADAVNLGNPIGGTFMRVAAPDAT